MAKNDDLTLTDVGFGKKVQINGRVYEYRGQDRKKKAGVSKTVYVFRLVDTKDVSTEFWEKTFDLNASLRIKKIGKKGDEVNFEIY